MSVKSICLGVKNISIAKHKLFDRIVRIIHSWRIAESREKVIESKHYIYIMMCLMTCISICRFLADEAGVDIYLKPEVAING